MERLDNGREGTKHQLKYHTLFLYRGQTSFIPRLIRLKICNIFSRTSYVSLHIGFTACNNWSKAFVLGLQTQDDAMIQLDRSGTHIITHGNESLRINIRDSLLECVSQFWTRDHVWEPSWLFAENCWIPSFASREKNADDLLFDIRQGGFWWTAKSVHILP